MRRWRTLPCLSGAYGWKDVPYARSEPSHAKQRLDVAVPRRLAPAAALPTCVFVHGGSWQRGGKSGGLNAGIDESLVRAGFLGVSVDYRLSPEVQHPAHAQDVAAAVAWLHANVARFGGDPQKLVLIGHSAGAHLVMQLLADPQYLRDAGVSEGAETFVRGAVGISGVYNVVRLANAAFYGSLVVNPAFGDRVEQWREASIGATVAKVGALKSPLMEIPLLLVNAEEDFHFQEDAKELESWLAALGRTAATQRHVIPGCNHFSIVQRLTENEDDATMALLKSFVEKVASEPRARAQ